MSLKFLLSCACYIRIAAYLYHGSHDDRVSVARQMSYTQPPGDSFIQQRRWYIPNELFTALCKHMIPLKRLLTNCRNLREILATTEELTADWYSRVQLLYFLGRYRDALTTLNTHFNVIIQDEPTQSISKILHTHHDERWNIIKLTSEILFYCFEYNAALQLYNFLAETDIEHEWLYMANCYVHLDQHIAASQVLSNIQTTTNRKVPGVYLTLGKILYKQGFYDLAKTRFVEALQIYHNDASHGVLFDYYGNPLKAVHSDLEPIDFTRMTSDQLLDSISNITKEIISCVISLGSIHRAMKNYKQAEKSFRKGLLLISALYGAQALVPLRATVLNSLGITLNKMQQYHNARFHYKQAYAMLLEIYGADAKNEELADILFNIAINLQASQQNDAAYETMERAMGMYKELSVNHPAIPNCQRFLSRYTWKGNIGAWLALTIISGFLLMLMILYKSGVLHF